MSLERGRYYALLGALMLRERRKRALTQTQIGKLVGISQPTVARIEAGKLPVSVLQFQKIASELFGVSHATLERRVQATNEVYQKAERAVRPEQRRIASRDAERKLIDYVVEVSA